MKRTRSWTERDSVTKFTNCKVLRRGQIIEVITKTQYRTASKHTTNLAVPQKDDVWVQNGKLIDPETR